MMGSKNQDLENFSLESDTTDSVTSSEQDEGVTYKIDDVPPWYMCLFLGLQHFLTMIGGTLSIPFILCPALCMQYDIEILIFR